jgi:serine/threonine protein kinase
MIYPSVGQYTEAIKLAEQSPEDYFATLTTLRPVLDADNNPVMSSGNFAVVFKMQDQTDGKIYALKCFTRDQEGRDESYRLIADELQYVESDYLTKIQYLENELFVDIGTDDTEFPVLLMDWVEGETLDKYIRKNIDNKYSLSMLAFRFSRLAMWLMPQPFAHGDLKPDNIIVRKDGSLTLVDYDGMYVPAMKGQKSRELGSPDFRHPNRTEDDFNEHIDDFSLSTIMLSLKAIAIQPSLLEEYGASDRLLLSGRDYSNISESKVLDALKRLMQDAELSTLLSLFIIALTQNNLSQVSFRLFYISRPNKDAFATDEFSTKVTDEEIEEGVVDEFGVVYSKDGEKLLGCKKYWLQEYVSKEGEKYLRPKYYKSLHEYEVKKGTKVICDWAFVGDYDEKYGFASSLQSITIPDSVISIGEGAFRGCVSLQSISIPNSVTTIGNMAFCDCYSLQNISLSDNLTNIGDYAFAWCETLQSITIPKGVISIGEGFIAGSGINTVVCSSILFEVHNNLLYFKGREKIHSYFGRERNFNIPDGVTIIGDGAFRFCKLYNITIPNGVTSIGERAFNEIWFLQSISLPDSIERIGKDVFEYIPPKIYISKGTLTKFTKLLGEKYANVLVEQ